MGSEKSVTMPDGSLHDLRSETLPADELGTGYAADEGSSFLLEGGGANTDDGEVTIESTAAFLAVFMQEFRVHIERVLIVLPRS